MSLELIAANRTDWSPAAATAPTSPGTPAHQPARGVIRLDAELHVLDACVTARRILGRRLDELVGSCLVDLVEDGVANLAALARRLSVGATAVAVVEVRPRALHAALPRCELTLNWLQDTRPSWAGSTPGGTFVIGISPLEREHGSPVDESTGGQIVEHVPDLVLRYRLWPERGFDYVSPSCHELLGYPAAAFYAHPDLFMDLSVDPAEISSLMQRWQDNTAVTSDPVIHLRHRDGRVRAFELRTTSMRSPERRVLAIEAVAREVSQRDEADQELRAIVAFRRNMHEVAGHDLDQAEPSEVLRAALTAVCDHTGWEVGHALVAGAEPGSLASADVWHLGTGDRFEAFRAVTDSQHWPADTDLAGDAFMLALPTVVETGQSDANERSRQATACGLRMAVIVPVPMGEGVGAVLEFLTEAPRASQSRAHAGAGRCRRRGGSRPPAHQQCAHPPPPG